MNEYNICRNTYTNLLENGSKYLEQVNNNSEIINNRSLKTASDKELDTAVITWFQHVRDRGDRISRPILKEKALLLSQKLNSLSTYKVNMCMYE